MARLDSTFAVKVDQFIQERLKPQHQRRIADSSRFYERHRPEIEGLCREVRRFAGAVKSFHAAFPEISLALRRGVEAGGYRMTDVKARTSAQINDLLAACPGSRWEQWSHEEVVIGVIQGVDVLRGNLRELVVRFEKRMDALLAYDSFRASFDNLDYQVTEIGALDADVLEARRAVHVETMFLAAGTLAFTRRRTCYARGAEQGPESDNSLPTGRQP